jgi:arylsulfatase A-like enzyme
VSEELGDPRSELPTFVSISGPSARAGFLGVEHDPFVVLDPGEPPANTGYPHDVDMVRFLRRKSALDALEADFAARTRDPKVTQRQSVYAKAVRMMYAPRLAAFALTDEPDAVRAAYGDGDFGRGCLLARRLVEAGVPFVEVTLDGWDTHQDNFGRTRKLMETLDPAFASLLKDLAERKLLDSTLVLCLGEFGRTPRINENQGRDHYPQAWSALLAGGGVRGGMVLGATDGDGGKVVERPTAVPDLFATLASQLGINPDKSMPTPLGRPLAVTDGGKVLHEILREG